MEVSAKCVSVTHFINPQLFWYHSSNVPNEHFREIVKLNQGLAELYKNKPPLRSYRPQMGDQIAVNFLAWNKFIRAHVQSLIELSNSTEYIVWASDYGFPFQTKVEHVRRLPALFAQHIDHIRCGGLANILPAEKEFDFMEKCAIMTVQKNWNQRACDMLEKLLTDAASITFAEKFQAAGAHFWGDLIIVNHKGDKFQAREYLIAINFGLDAGPNFSEQCLSLCAITISPWLSNNGNNKYKANTLNTTVSVTSILGDDSSLNYNDIAKHYNDIAKTSTISGDNSGINYNDIAKRKVEDWHARNELNEQCSAGALLPLESPVESSAGDEIDDISFNDSVSIKNNAMKQLKSPSSVSGSLRSVSGGAKPKHPASKQVPPKPSYLAFKINPIEAPPTTSPVVAHSPAANACHLQFLSEDAQIVLDKNRDFRTPPASSSSSCKVNDVTATPPASVVSSKSARNKRLLEIRNNRESLFELTNQGAQNITARSPSSVGSDGSTPNYQQLQESNSQVESPQNNDRKERNTSLSEIASTCSRNSYNRSKHLIEMRQRFAKNKADEKQEMPGNQVGPGTSIISADIETDDDKSSIISKVSAPQAKHLMSLRKKFQDMNNNQPKPQQQSIIDKQTSVLFKKVPIEPTDIPFEFPDFAAISRSSTQTRKSDIDCLPAVPAGFDLTRLCHYKNEENHWHRKKTTRHDHIPHDTDLHLNSSTVEDKLLNSSSSSDQWNPRDNASGIADHDDKSSLTLCNAKRAKEQNFRLTRPHTDKHKGERAILTQRCILDTTVPDIKDTAMSPCVERKPGENLLPQHTDISSSSLPSRLKRRQLKSPTRQMDKMELILRRAKFEQQVGNPHILDLSNLNSSGNKTDSDSYAEANSASDGSGSEDTTSNKTALLKSSQLTKNQETSSKGPDMPTTPVKQIKEQQKIEKPLTPEEMKLELLAKNLNFQLKTVLLQPQQLREVSGEAALQTKFIDHLVLAHSKVPLQPLERISDAFFLQEIHEQMVSMHLTKVYRIQAYAWSHLLRGNSLFVVNPKQTGKTFCYLPPICSLVSYRLQTLTLPETYGPVAIILVSSSTHVEMVYRECRRLLVRIKEPISVVPSFGIRNANDAKVQLLNSCGILVATPANLLRLLHDNENESLIDPARLQHLIIDDLHLMLSRSKSDLEAVLRAVFKLCKRTGGVDKLGVQLVVTSSDWDAALMVAMMRRSNQPLLLIGDFLEAAVYGKAELSIKLKPHEQKIKSVVRFIERHPLDLERLLIFCNCDEDVDEVVLALTSSGYACIGYCSRSSAEVRVTIEEWKQKMLFSQILVCTDASFPELQIQNVQNLIHYSMPTLWTKFTYRFSSLAKTYENFVGTGFQSSSNNTAAKPVASSLILLDEENSMQLPRLMAFMKKHKQLEYIPADILTVSKRVQVQREQELIAKGTRMCPYVLEFGECDEQRCYFRHNLTPFDTVTKADNIPAAGDMRILILKVISPTHYTARLLQHKVPNSTKWRQLRRSNEAAVFGMQLNMHYKNAENWILHWPPQVNDLCVCKVAHNVQRARIIEVAALNKPGVSVVQKVKVTVRLIDVGKVCDVKSDELFVCAAGFKDFPALAIDIRLAGLVPFDNERTWDSNATRAVQKWIMTDIKKNESVHVSINFALSNTIWVNNVIVMEQLPTVGQYVYRVNLRRSLVEKNFAMFSNAEQKSIRDIAEELNLLQVLSESEENETEFESCNNDSNLMKMSFNDSHETSSSDAKNIEKNKPNEYTDDSIENVEENWDNSVDDKIHGDDEVYLPLTSNEKPQQNIPTENTIATNLNVLNHEKWCALPLHQIVKIEIGDESENGNWKDMYVQIIDQQHTEQFEELSEIIRDHVEALQQQESSEPFVEDWFQPMQNCIIKYDEQYLRAKLHKIYGGPVNERIYQFYLCDYACFETIKASEIYNDRLYTTTDKITEFTPYQSIHCTLAGIQLDQFAKRYQVTKSYLFAYAVAMRTNSDATPLGVYMKSHEILLYECDTDQDFNAATMLNNALVEHGVAALDPNTKHLLELDVSHKDKMLSSYEGSPESAEKRELLNYEELLQCMQRHFEFEAEEMAREISAEAADVDENGAKTRKTLVETKAICAAAVEKQRNDYAEKQQQRKKLIPCATELTKPEQKPKLRKKSYAAAETTVQATNASTSTSDSSNEIPITIRKPLRQICDSDEELLISSSASDTNSAASSICASSTSDSKIYTPAPPLTVQHKRPQTTWYETDFHIYLSIHAPDIDEYYLEVTPTTLIFFADVHDQQQALVLNFLGTVETNCVSHELRGLNVVVRLVKSIFMKWPRLLQQPTKFPWLTYDLNAIDTHEIEHLLPQQRLHLALQNAARGDKKKHDGYYDDTDSDDDGERNLYQTYTPIHNSEDIHDPTAEIF